MRRSRAIALGVLAVAAVGGAGLATAGLGGGGGSGSSGGPKVPATAAVERTTLTETQKVDGTLGYGDTTALSAASGGSGGSGKGGGGSSSGTITWLPSAGTKIGRGEPAYRVDNRPVPLLYGRMPLYRTLKDGVSGTDVLQFERNLAALGYSGFDVDKEYSSATATAVKEWQEDLGMEETGQVAPGSVVVARDEIRVAERRAQAGDRASGQLLTYTGTTRVVTVNLDVKYQKLAKAGAGVTIDLPDGGSTKGTISSVGKVATQAKADDPTTVKVTVEIGRQRALGSYDKAPVDVYLTASKHASVLAVPVGALVALPGGGYGVQVVPGASAPVRTVKVDTGVFAQGKVEVTGSGVTEGTKVVVPT
ncbi:peptidoglycan-binding domain-containing protein [Actinomadura oligospora]|uniref:peptidoglycan-binding domain-containing protein n=1 Tax=Actinomadura oligospora TaxID=111804 RepID=UPI00047D8167|nr:peptidoglycan-binding domain-containing protein [Actinomadura oligospora]